MKKYVKPLIVDEIIEIEDIISTSISDDDEEELDPTTPNN